MSHQRPIGCDRLLRAENKAGCLPGGEVLSLPPPQFWLSGAAEENVSSESAQRCSGHSPAEKPFRETEREREKGREEKRKRNNYREGIRNEAMRQNERD